MCSTHITTLALVVNELATNAIKHAYAEDKPGQIQITIGKNSSHDVAVIVDDDGLPFSDPKCAAGDVLELGLAKRLMAPIGGLFIPPAPGAKAFELRAPVQNAEILQAGQPEAPRHAEALAHFPVQLGGCNG